MCVFELISYCRTGFDSDGLTAAKIATENDCCRIAIEIMPIVPYVGVVFSFMGLLSLDRYHVYLLMILKKTLTFLSLSNPVLQYYSCIQSFLFYSYCTDITYIKRR